MRGKFGGKFAFGRGLAGRCGKSGRSTMVSHGQSSKTPYFFAAIEHFRKSPTKQESVNCTLGERVWPLKLDPQFQLEVISL